MEHTLQLDEVAGSQTGTSGVKGSGAPCQAISPIMECGRQTAFINIQMRRNEAAQEKCVAQLLSGGGSCARRNKDAAVAACVGTLPGSCSESGGGRAPCFLAVYLGFSEYQVPAEM